MFFFISDKYVRAECPCLSARYTVALLACFGFSIMFGMRCNMSMAKLKMTEKHEVSSLQLLYSHKVIVLFNLMVVNKKEVVFYVRFKFKFVFRLLQALLKIPHSIGL